MVSRTSLLIISLLLNTGLRAQETDTTFGHLCFFEENSFSTGLGLPYSLHHEIPGINGRAYYNWREKWCAGPEISVFSQSDLAIIDLNLVIHYIFETPVLGIYPVLGFNYTSEKEQQHQQDAMGLMVGIGLHRNFKKWTVFAEHTRVEGPIRDQFITGGLMYSFATHQGSKEFIKVR